MTSSPAPSPRNILRNEALSPRNVGYYSQRFRHQVFGRLIARFAELAEREGMTKAGLVRMTGKDAAQINRALAIPSNFTLDTISLLALAMGCEPEMVLHDLEEHCTDNYVHPLMVPAERSGIHSTAKNRTSISRKMDQAGTRKSALINSTHAWQPLATRSSEH